MRRLSAQAKAALVAVVFSLAASFWLATWEGFYKGVASESVASSAAAPSQQASQPREFSASLIQVNGLKALPLLVFPVAIPLIALLATLWPDVPGGKVILWANAAMVIAFCLIALSSIGMFYLPAAVALMTAAVVHQWSAPLPATRQQRRRASKQQR